MLGHIFFLVECIDNSVEFECHLITQHIDYIDRVHQPVSRGLNHDIFFFDQLCHSDRIAYKIFGQV